MAHPLTVGERVYVEGVVSAAEMQADGTVSVTTDGGTVLTLLCSDLRRTGAPVSEFPKLMWKDGAEITVASAADQAAREADGYACAALPTFGAPGVPIE